MWWMIPLVSAEPGPTETTDGPSVAPTATETTDGPSVAPTATEATDDPSVDPTATGTEPVAPVEEPVQAEPTGTSAPIARDDGSDTLLEAGGRLLDERLSTALRCEAADALGRSGDERSLWLLRAAADDADPSVRRAAVDAALRFQGPEAVGVALPYLRSRTPFDARLEIVDALGTHGSPEAAALLADVSVDREVPARVRASALSTLEQRYPDAHAALGGRRGVADPVGRLAAIGGNTLLGGTLLSSVGTWGQFEGGPVLGAVGGGAIGLGSGVLYASGRQLTAGQGLAYASGIGWGTAYGVWTTHAVHGRRQFMDWYVDERTLDRSRDLGAAYRAVGVGAGAAVGGWAASRDPLGWDVLEVDLAGYLGSAVVLAGTGLATYRPPADTGSLRSYDERRVYQLAASRRLAASAMVGSAAGLGVGALLSDRWDLDWDDGVFAFTLGAEAAWLGAWVPRALEIDDRDLKGTIRLPWHAAAIGGLVIAELEPMSLGRSGAGAVGMMGGNALGAGLPLVAGAKDGAMMARVMVPVGLATTTGAILAGPTLDPHGGDWVMLGVAVPVATAQSMALGSALFEADAITEDQLQGFPLLGGGATGLGLLVLAPAVDPAPDAMVALGSAAVWGGYFGAMTPHALRLDGRSASVPLLAGAVTSEVFLVGTGVALLPQVGLRPADLVLPELGGLTGATTGALVAALASGESEDVALGSVLGATVGIGTGAVVRATVGRSADLHVGPVGRLPGTWSPHLGQHIGPDGTPVPTWGLRADRW